MIPDQFDEPIVLTEPGAIRELIVAMRADNRRVGFVPTMGNLHDGHASLIRAASQETDSVVVSIFVNPIQFVAGEDYDRYPRTPEQDLRICRDLGVEAVFMPVAEEFYRPNSTTRIRVRGLDEPMCGKFRPGHFEGVATVVAKLFHCVPANVAFFGLKDYQQCKVIERMVCDLDFPIDLRFCPTVREPDGLALSSRNAYLRPDERRQAVVLRRMLDRAEYLLKSGERDVSVIRQAMRENLEHAPSAQLDYIEILDADTLEPIDRIDRPAVAAVALRFSGARLIDNAILVPRPA